jgi:hypothetical protein
MKRTDTLSHVENFGMEMSSTRRYLQLNPQFHTDLNIHVRCQGFYLQIPSEPCLALIEDCGKPNNLPTEPANDIMLAQQWPNSRENWIAFQVRMTWALQHCIQASSHTRSKKTHYIRNDCYR